MSTGPRRRHLRRHRSPPTELARDWAWELAAAGLIQHTRAELELHLRGQVDRLLTLLHADPYRPAPAREVGAYLVSIDARDADALGRTFLLLSRRLLADSPLSQDGARDRLDRLLAELITGWVEAQHAAIVAAQEDLRRAIDAARHRSLGPWFTPSGPAAAGSLETPPGQ